MVPSPYRLVDAEIGHIGNAEMMLRTSNIPSSAIVGWTSGET